MPALAPYTGWQAKMLLMLVPSAIYAVLFAGQDVPVDRTRGRRRAVRRHVQGDPAAAVHRHLAVACGSPRATELGPGQWVSNIFNDVMKSSAQAGILVLGVGQRHHVRDAAVSGRRRASPIAHRADRVHAPSPAAAGLFLFGIGHDSVDRVRRRRASSPPAPPSGGRRCSASRRSDFRAAARWLLAIIGATGSFSTAIAGPIMGWINDRYGADRVLSIWAILPAVLALIFTALYLSDRVRGGYRVERIGPKAAA